MLNISEQHHRLKYIVKSKTKSKRLSNLPVNVSIDKQKGFSTLVGKLLCHLPHLSDQDEELM